MFMYYFILFFILRPSTAQGDCSPTRCSHHGPKIRFPFCLKNHHPPHCGYHGFDLSCSPNTSATLLNLPDSVQVLVTNIDYKSQLIDIKDPNKCFPQKLQNLNLSATPFQFADPVYNFSLFSCPPSTDPDPLYQMIPCLGGDGHEVRVMFNGSIQQPASWLISCRKMFNVPSVPYEVFDQTPHLQLKWLQPVCGECEAKGKFCRLKRNSKSDEIECFGDLNPLKKDRGEELGIDIQDEGDAKIAKKLAIVGLQCIQWYPVDRPSMHVVIQMLEGDGDTLIKPPNPFASTNPTMATGQTSGRPFNSELEVIVESD